VNEDDSGDQREAEYLDPRGYIAAISHITLKTSV
jgi:hypothetical protein